MPQPLIFNILKKLSYLLDRRDKIQVILLFFILLGVSVLEMLGVGFVVPFISLISNPDSIQEKPILNTLYHWIGNASDTQFLVILCLIYLGIYVIKNSYIAGSFYLQYRFIYNKQIKLSDQLFQGYLGAPYHFHLQKNSALLIRNLTQEINQLFTQVLIPIVMLITELTVLTGLVMLLVILRPIPSLAATGGLLVAGFLFYQVFQTQLYKAGKNRQYYSGLVIKDINQGLGGVKETKILGREPFFLARHRIHRKELVRSLESVQIIQQLPRLYFETLAVFALLSVILVTLLQGMKGAEILPTLALFAASAFRLIPSLNRVMSSLNKIRFGTHALDMIVHEFRSLEEEKNLLWQQTGVIPALSDQLSLKNIAYAYPNTEEKVLSSISIEIPKGTSVGFVGSSGAGKTTLIDIILGLLTPTEGTVLVDGVDIQNGLSAWQKQIGYIPQDIYLCDDTLRGNIAFGIPEKEISEAQVSQAVQSAQLQAFIEKLPQGLDTVVGERGVRLSGGQRQRVGIARSLYHNPQVLVMDEATAALDNETEAEIMKAIEKLSGEKTLIMIAHRLTTVKNCDCLYFLEGGKIRAQGTYKELRDRDEHFMKMARVEN